MTGPRPIAAPPRAPDPNAWTIYAGVDPGAHTGLVCVAMPDGGTRIHDARYIGSACVEAGTSTKDHKANVRARLFHKVRDQLGRWRVDVAVFEEPWDALPVFGAAKKGLKGRGASRGTLFSLGASFGLALAAAADLPWPVAIITHPVTTESNPRKKPRLGWMQRRNGRCPPHEQTANESAHVFRELRQRPHNGVLPTAAELAAEIDDNILMALGVLNFELDRRRGAV